MSSIPISIITARCLVLLLLEPQVALLRDPPDGVHSAARMKTNMLYMLELARAACPSPIIIHVRNRGDKGEPDEPGAPGWHLEFPVLPDEHILDKTKNNAFAGTALSQLIPTDAVIIVTGMLSDYAVRSTCSAALDRGNKVVLIRGAHATYDGMKAYHEGTIPASRIEAEIEAELQEAGVMLLNMSTLPSIFVMR